MHMSLVRWTHPFRFVSFNLLFVYTKNLYTFFKQRCSIKRTFVRVLHVLADRG